MNLETQIVLTVFIMIVIASIPAAWHLNLLYNKTKKIIKQLDRLSDSYSAFKHELLHPCTFKKGDEVVYMGSNYIIYGINFNINNAHLFNKWEATLVSTNELYTTKASCADLTKRIKK